MNRLLDTDTCVYIIRGKQPDVRRRLEACTVGEVCVSSITVAELSVGALKSARPSENTEALKQFLLPLVVLSFGEAAAFEYGNVRTHLEAAGTKIGALDTFIAAHARSVGATLVTNNTREFSRVPGLQLENWIAGDGPKAVEGGK